MSEGVRRKFPRRTTRHYRRNPTRYPAELGNSDVVGSNAPESHKRFVLYPTNALYWGPITATQQRGMHRKHFSSFTAKQGHFLPSRSHIMECSSRHDRSAGLAASSLDLVFELRRRRRRARWSLVASAPTHLMLDAELGLPPVVVHTERRLPAACCSLGGHTFRS